MRRRLLLTVEGGTLSVNIRSVVRRRRLAGVLAVTLITGLAAPALSATSTPSVTQTDPTMTKLSVHNGYYFGHSVAVDGDTAVIGATNAAYVYVRKFGQWWRQQRLVEPIPSQMGIFGGAVISGNTIFVTGGLPTQHSTVYVFKRERGVWTPRQVLLPSVPDNSTSFGNAMAMNGTTAVIGAPGQGVGGAAYVFTANKNGVWRQTARLLPAHPQPDEQFGESVALDGSLALVGAPDRPGGGGADLFVGSGTTWTRTRVLSPPPTLSAWPSFGSSVSLRGGVASVGAVGFEFHGAVYLYPDVVSPDVAAQQLVPSDGESQDCFGCGQALTPTELVVCNPNHFTGLDTAGSQTFQGVCYRFVPVAGVWTQVQEFSTTDGTFGGFGAWVAAGIGGFMIGAPDMTHGAAYWMADPLVV
jgi:hypothetical protein